MDVKRAIEFLARSQAEPQARFESWMERFETRMERSDARMDRIEATLDRLAKRSQEHELWMNRNDRKLAALIQASHGHTLEHRRFMKEMRALGKRMDTWLRGGG